MTRRRRPTSPRAQLPAGIASRNPPSTATANRDRRRRAKEQSGGCLAKSTRSEVKIGQLPCVTLCQKIFLSPSDFCRRCSTCRVLVRVSTALPEGCPLPSNTPGLFFSGDRHISNWLYSAIASATRQQGSLTYGTPSDYSGTLLTAKFGFDAESRPICGAPPPRRLPLIYDHEPLCPSLHDINSLVCKLWTFDLGSFY